MFDGRLPSFANTRSMRVAGGLGHGRARRRRRAGNLRPAHSGRRRARAASRASTSPITARCAACSPACTAISARPCWSTATPCRRPPGAKDERPRADIVLGDRYGTSCVAGGGRDDRGRRLREHGLFGQPQQALCGRLHHRALRQSGRGPARHPARDQPRALYGRAALSSARPFRARSRPTSRRSPTGSAKSRSRSCGRTAPPPSSRMTPNVVEASAGVR